MEPADRSYVNKTSAKAHYCLSDKDLKALQPVLKRNPRYRNSAPMQLYKHEALEQLAIQKYGSLAALDAERAKRATKREERSQRTMDEFLRQGHAGSAAPATADGDAADARCIDDAESLDTVAGEGLPYWIAERIRIVGAAQLHEGVVGNQTAAQAAVPLAPATADAAEAPQASTGVQTLQLQQKTAVRVVLNAADSQAAQPAAGAFVLYWMNTAMRAHENPALDVAAYEAHKRGLPLLVAAFVLGCHPYPTARRWKFMLEGLRDVQQDAAGKLPIHVYLDGWTHLQPRQGTLTHEPAVMANPDLASSAAAALTVQPPQHPSGHGQIPTALSPETPPPHALSVSTSSDDVSNFNMDVGHMSPSSAGATAEQQTTQTRAAAVPDTSGALVPPSPLPDSSPGWQALLDLARAADLVVVEEMPVPPEVQWVAQLAGHLAPGSVWAVDSSCCLPMQFMKQPCEMAWAFRSKTKAPRSQRLKDLYAGSLAALWSRLPLPTLAPGAVPWPSLDCSALTDDDILQLLRNNPACDNHIPGVPHLKGGTTAAYARWQAFRQSGGLASYPARRNNALDRNGVSRLSAYHHFGMLSPFKVARECQSQRGSDKYLDEFLTWRELSYAFCFHKHAVLHTLQVLPKCRWVCLCRWAQNTLAAHAGDPRHVIPPEQIETGRTGDAFWDAAQQQMIVNGELHNNARMTWGKALLPWLPTPTDALLAVIHLNHKYCLDGCDPCSYGGVLWCFGLFDKPKNNANTPIYGSLRQRPTSVHATRISVPKFKELLP